MDDDEECSDDNCVLGGVDGGVDYNMVDENYVLSGVEGDVDYNMIDSLFQLSAYVSDNDKDDRSDDNNKDDPTLLQRRTNGSGKSWLDISHW
jgi:hypothetical protein